MLECDSQILRDGPKLSKSRPKRLLTDGSVEQVPSVTAPHKVHKASVILPSTDLGYPTSMQREMS